MCRLSIGPLKTSAIMIVYAVRNSKGSSMDRFSSRVNMKDKTMQCTVVDVESAVEKKLEPRKMKFSQKEGQARRPSFLVFTHGR